MHVLDTGIKNRYIYHIETAFPAIGAPTKRATILGFSLRGAKPEAVEEERPARGGKSGWNREADKKPRPSAILFFCIGMGFFT